MLRSKSGGSIKASTVIISSRKLLSETVLNIIMWIKLNLKTVKIVMPSAGQHQWEFTSK